MNKTVYEKGIEDGIEKGIREVLHEVLEEQFGPLAPAVLERLEQMSADQLRALRKAARQAASLRDLGLEV
jgi:hypothetical protein